MRNNTDRKKNNEVNINCFKQYYQGWNDYENEQMQDLQLSTEREHA